MNTKGLQIRKINIEKAMILFGMTCMEGIGLIMLVCGIFGVKIF